MTRVPLMFFVVSTAFADVSVKVWGNTAQGGAPSSTSLLPQLAWSAPGADLVSAEFVAELTAPESGSYSFECRTSDGSSVLMWLDDHLVCGTVELFRPETAPLPPFYALRAHEPHFLRLQFVHNESSPDAASVSLLWNKPDSDQSEVPASALRVPGAAYAAQETRVKMQQTLATGWGTWFRPSALAATLLPEAATLTVGVCQLSMAVCMDPTAPFTPEQTRGPEEPKSVATSRPGLHTPNYWQMYLSYHGTIQEPSPSLLNVSLEWVGTGAGQGAGAVQDLTLLATVVSGNASDFVLTVSGAFYYNRVGNVSLGSQALTLSAHGLRISAAHAITSPYPHPLNISQPSLALDLNAGAAAVSTSGGMKSVAAVQAAVSAARTRAVIQIASTVKNHELLSEASNVMFSGCLWNFIYHPTQLGPFVTVSRSFTAQPYELFEWDTYFGATMLSFSEELLPLALSSLIQITKSKTMGPQLDGHGFVPGYSKGGRWLSEDRTERPIGSQTVLRVWRRWHGVRGMDLTWLLQLVYPDLLDWNEWLFSKRLLAPLGLGGMGSDSCFVPGTTKEWCKPSWGMGQLQGARFESLDNSPMYDPPTNYSMWDSGTQRMRLYDVGQSAAFVAESEALAAIATQLGRTADATMLTARQDKLSALIQKHMWIPELSVFSNVLLNGSAYPRIAPTR